MRDFLGIGAIVILFIAIVMCILMASKKMDAATNNVQIIEREGHKFIIVTGEKCVAICPVPK